MENEENTIGNKFIAFFVGAVIVFTLFTLTSKHRVGAKCWDGTESYSTGRGTCSHHGGVKYWKHEYWWD